MDLLLGIEAFVRVAETESFANAARQLGVAKSVITTRVKQLEEHLGVALFHRSTRAVRLSDNGRAYQECRVAECHNHCEHPATADVASDGIHLWRDHPHSKADQRPAEH